MASFLICRFGIVQELEEYFFYGLENEEEHEFLGAVDLETVSVIDEVDKITVEKVEKKKRSELNNYRFVH